MSKNRKTGRPRGALPGWAERVTWWATHGAGHGTPHVPHQWIRGGGSPFMNCARCGDVAEAGGRELGGGRRRPPACRNCAVDVDTKFDGGLA